MGDDTERQTMEIRFPGGMAVTARFRGQEILTDQPREAGGAGDPARAVDQCAVKRHILEPPEVDVALTD